MRILSALMLIFCFGFATYAQASFEPVKQQVNSSGETTLRFESETENIEVVISAHEVDIGSPHEPSPATKHTSCTYSKFPCSIVDNIMISVNSKPIYIARSAFCDIADVSTAALISTDKGYCLELHYGSDFLVYIATLRFDEQLVYEREVLLTNFSDVVEKTWYSNKFYE
ncbi:hypothetical protein [Desulfatibacillum aliphaticivorans]|uniref:hypothetical protein n=1 Tax=Desulfatibacillum aliphaticivorans TaxID=218208 RepID=UPI0004879C1A|nr:hypothetical protein [Desulfatibacillum aliphaticivorans]